MAFEFRLNNPKRPWRDGELGGLAGGRERASLNTEPWLLPKLRYCPVGRVCGLGIVLVDAVAGSCSTLDLRTPVNFDHIVLRETLGCFCCRSSS